MTAIKEFIDAALGIILVIVMWGIGCMLVVVPFVVGIWLWNKVL